jgi:hypothetical protein
MCDRNGAAQKPALQRAQSHNPTVQRSWQARKAAQSAHPAAQSQRVELAQLILPVPGAGGVICSGMGRAWLPDQTASTPSARSATPWASPAATASAPCAPEMSEGITEGSAADVTPIPPHACNADGEIGIQHG